MKSSVMRLSLDSLFASLLVAFWVTTGSAVSQRKPRKAQEPRFYKGREIAQTMHYFGAPWLVRESRQREEDCKQLLAALKVKSGDVVCDMGCGNGFYTLPIAKLVGPTGKVIAVDIQKQMLTLLRQRAAKTDHADRIETIHSTPRDPKLPDAAIDLILLVDVYHEFSDPEAMLRAMHKSLKPGGRIVLAEFRMEDPKVPIKRLHKMSKRQILRELPPNGFRLVEQYDRLPWQHLMFFERQDADADGFDTAVRGGLRRATQFIRGIAVKGGYAGIYSLDLERRFGEALYEKATKDEIWIQPPGTPSVAEVMLRAFELTGEDLYFDGARDAGLALAWAQRTAGGWGHRADLSALDRGAARPKRAKGRCTFDDNISQGALTSLIELDTVLEESWLRESIEIGLRHLLDAQFENGAWPQWYPLRGGYHDHYTFNDNAINDCIRVAQLAFSRYGKPAYRRAALAGGGFILGSQIEAPQAGWAQQYSHDGRPAAARAFEPVGVCSAVTVRNLRTLLNLHQWSGEDRFLAPFEPAIDWLRRSKLAPGQWARFYELKTNKPIYGDRDGKVRYSLSEVSAERRNGYSWQGGYGVATLIRRHEERINGTSGPRGVSSRPDRRASVQAALKALDDRGRWVRDGRIHVGDYVRYARLLCAYLAAPPE